MTVAMTQIGSMLDISKPAVGVQIQIRSDGKVIWLNVDGQCRVRVCGIPSLEIEDGRRQGDER